MEVVDVQFVSQVVEGEREWWFAAPFLSVCVFPRRRAFSVTVLLPRRTWHAGRGPGGWWLRSTPWDDGELTF